MHTLYWAPGTCAIAPRIVLEEIGAPYLEERVVIDQQSRNDILVGPDYLKINPKGRVPALATGDRVLTEAPAIMVYLARANPGAALMPQDAEGEARVLEWLGFLSTAVHAVAFGQIVRPQRFVEDAEAFPLVVAKGRKNVATAYAHIEAQLSGRQWAAGDHYSLADIYLLFFYLGSKRFGNPMEKNFPAWAAVAERAIQRPAVKRALKREEGAPVRAAAN